MNKPSGAISPYYVRLQRRLKAVSLGTGIVTILIALMTLTGWNNYLTTYLHVPLSFSVMNPTTAFCFLLAGMAVVLLTVWPFNRSFMLFSIMVAVILIFCGLLRLLNLAGFSGFYPDLIFFSARTGNTDGVIRMTFITSFGLIITGLIFLLKEVIPGKRYWVQYLLFGLMISSFFSFIAIVDGVDEDYPGSSFLKMHLVSAVCFLFLSVSVLAGEYDNGTMSVITSNKTGGRMARKFLPFILLFPVLIGIVDRLAEETGLYKDSLGLTIFSLLMMIVFFIIVLRSASSSNNIHNWLLQEIEERKKAEQEARDSNVFVNAIYENIPNMVFVKEGEELRYKSINKAGEELIGHTRQELLGKCDHDFFPKEEADFFRAKDREVFTSDKPVIAEEPITTPEYGLRWLRTKKIGIRDAGGNPLYMIGISEDITELKVKEEKLKRYNERLELEVKERTYELRKSEERYHRMVEEVQDYAILLLDPQGNIVNWNKGAERIKGYKAEEIIGKSFKTFYTKEDRESRLPFRLLEEARNKGKAFNEGWRIKKDGSLFRAFVVLTALFDEDNSLIGFSKVSRDITEAREAEHQKLEYERRFRLTINRLGDNAWEYNFDTGITSFSDNIEELLGYKAIEFTENKSLWWDITYQPDRWILQENDRRYTSGEISHHASEYRIYHKDGSIKWILDRGVVIDKKADGKPARVVGIHMDITKRKEAERMVVENELRFRDLTQNVPGVIYQWIERPDGSFGFTYVSPKLKDYFGIAPEDMDKLSGYIHPEDKERWRASIEESKANGTSWFFEGRLILPGERLTWWRGSSVIALKNENGTIYNGLLMDITEQKLIEEKIIKDQKRYEAIFNSQYQFIGLTTPDGILAEANEAILDFAGVQAEDVIGKHCWECYWWAGSADTQQRLKEATARAANGEFVRYETEITGKEGRIAIIDFSIKPVFDDNNEVILLISEGRDITGRKLLEKRAKEQEDQIRLFVKHTPAAIAMFDDQMRYMVASDRWYHDYGLEGQEIMGKSHYEIFPEIERMEEWKAIHQRCLAGAVELREQDAFPRADGAMEWLRWEIYPWRTNDDKIGGIIMFTEVITDRIKAKEHQELLNKQLTESNRELEQFAYVASHDLQEPLRMVSSFLQLLDKKYNNKLDEKASQYIHFAVDGSERMKALIDDLLKLSRVGTASGEKTAVDCNEVVKNVIRVYAQNIKKEGAIVNISGLPVINGSKTQIEQLFQNLIGNALKYRKPDPLIIDIGCEADDTEYVFFVKDNGIGIDPKFFEKVFVIFQRLHGKNEYSGTGIGLSICKKIVERHGGKMWVESSPGKGAAFYFSLPRS